jgi:fucose 4-O-acetylase-like acetyltransferase
MMTVGRQERALMSPDRLARATPRDRDRVIDAVRVASLLVVVLGHWLMASVTMTADGVAGANALSAMPWLHPATWVLQVMPLFFIAGGFANRRVWLSARRRGDTYADYLSGRMGRLLRPTMIFVLAVPLILTALLVAGVPGDLVTLVGGLLAQPLWFLAVYVAVTAMAPAMAAWHERRPAGAVAVLAGAAVAVDAVRLAGVDVVGYLNFGVVWLLAQQLGFWYADGRLHRLSRARFAAIGAGAVALLIALTTWGPYPVSMVGLPGELSNMAPPTVCLVVLTVAQLMALMLVRARLARWLERPRTWALLVGLGSASMTMYLWHLLVLVIGVGAMLAVGIVPPEPGSAGWWVTRPLWLALLAMILGVFVVGLRRFERGQRPAAVSPASAVVGTALVVIGLFGVVLGGLAPSWSLLAMLGVLGSGVMVVARP